MKKAVGYLTPYMEKERVDKKPGSDDQVYYVHILPTACCQQSARNNNILLNWFGDHCHSFSIMHKILFLIL